MVLMEEISQNSKPNERAKARAEMLQKPFKFQLEMGFRQFFASVLMLTLFFFVPIQLITNWGSISADIKNTFASAPSNAQVLGISTDNTGRYFNIPIVNFKFDSTMRDPATISFSFGFILLLLSVIIILLMFADFRKKERKYR